MNIAIPELISQIIEGLKNYFEVTQIQVKENFYEELMIILSTELAKPFNEQIYTPTQMLNCLLYTSPSPRDPTKSRMPSSA